MHFRQKVHDRILAPILVLGSLLSLAQVIRDRNKFCYAIV